MENKIIRSEKYQIVEFNKTKIVCPIFNGQPYFVIKSISDDIGMNYKAVSRAVKKHPRLGSRITELRPVKDFLGLSSKHSYPCLPIHKLGSWLYSINPNDINQTIRPRLVFYQEKCDDVLMESFFGGTKNVISFHQKRLPVKNDINEKQDELVKAIESLEGTEEFKAVGVLKDEIKKLKQKLNRIDKSFIEPEIFGYE